MYRVELKFNSIDSSIILEVYFHVESFLQSYAQFQELEVGRNLTLKRIVSKTIPKILDNSAMESIYLSW